MSNMTFKANLLPDNTEQQRALGSSSAKWAINGVSDPKLTDTLPTISLTGNGNAITTISINNSEITASKDAVFSSAINGVYYGICDTAQATKAKTVTLINGTNFTLATGCLVAVKFINAAAASTMTLNVDNTGAKNLYLYGTTVMSSGTSTNGWRAGAVVLFVYDGTLGQEGWRRIFWENSTYWNESIYISTAADIAEKIGSGSYTLEAGKYFQVLITKTNIVASALTLNINGKGAKPIYINGEASSSSNYNLPQGYYLVYYDGTNYYFRTDNYITGNITGSSQSVQINELTNQDLNDIHPNDIAYYYSAGQNSVDNKPSNVDSFGLIVYRVANGYKIQELTTPGGVTYRRIYDSSNNSWDNWTQLKFTDTTYSNLAAANNGTAVSLVTTGEKYIWNAKTSNVGTVTSVRVQATSPIVSSQNIASTSALDTTISLSDEYGDIKNPYGEKTKNYILAASATANSAPSFRALVDDDIPNLAWSKITSGNDDLKAIEDLSGATGFLKKTAVNTWTLDTNTYNNYEHPTTAGYKHIPSGGEEGQHLIYGGSSGTAEWADIPVTSVASKTGDVTLGTLTVGNKTYNGSTDTTIEISDLGLASVTQFLGITDTQLSDGDTTSPVNIVVGPTTGNISSFTNGDIVMRQDTGDEFIWTGNKWNFMGLASSWALANHIHGNILNNGTITSNTSSAIGQHLVITDSNDRVSRSSLAFESNSSKYLCNNGTWSTVSFATCSTYAAQLAHTPNNRTTFLRGDNTFSSSLEGNIYTKGYYLNQASASSTQANHAAIYIWGDNARFTYRDSSNAYLGEAFRYNITNGDAELMHNVGIPAGNLRVGTEGNTTAQRIVSIASGAGSITFYSDAATDGRRGFWANAHGTGAAKNVIFLDTNNNITYSGGNVSGSLTFNDVNIGIQRVGRSANWNKGRDSALVKTTSINGYGALASVKTTNGSWDIGAYNNASYTDDLLFTYVTDAQYNGTSAVHTSQIKFLENGHIVAALDGNALTCSEVKAGAANKMAYYSGATAISAAANIYTNGSYIHIYNNADIAGATASTNAPFLIGSPTAQHLIIDNNEILSKVSPTTAGTLSLGDTNCTVYASGTGGLIVPNGRLAVGGRTTWNNNSAGVYLSQGGDIHLAHASIPGIFFHHANASANTASIRETASATLRVSTRLAVNADSAIQYMNGATGNFILYVNGAIGANSGIWSSSDIVFRKNWTSTTAYSNCVSWYNESQNYGYIRLYRGTAASAGWSDLVLGNNIAQGTAKNSDGRIFLYNKAGACPMIWSDRTTLGGTARDAIRLNYLQASQVWGAVWNDYAEFRQTNDKNIKPGNCVIETGNGDLILSTERMQAGAEIVSDTYGMAIGETKINNTPIATAGRVLAYIYESKDIIKQHIGEPVCSGPNGTVSLMTEEECKLFPYKMIGTISEIPNYEIWEAGSEEEPININVNGRIWIRIR